MLDDANKPVSVEQLALSLPKRDWRKLSWREGTNEPLSGRFARFRARSAHDRDAATKAIPVEWLLIEWPDDENAPTKFWFSTLDKTVTFAHLVRTTKQRWRIERDYLELKQEIGLGHFEGRSWRGFHHHATLCIAAYGFLISERAAFSPSAACKAGYFEVPALPELPIRTERHILDSLATLRRELAVGLAATLDRCPCCAKPARLSQRWRNAA